jgi:hypothetical protein
LLAWDLQLGLGGRSKIADETGGECHSRTSARPWPETGFAEIKVRAAFRIAGISSNVTSGPDNFLSARHPSNRGPSEIFSSAWSWQASVLPLNFFEDGNVGVCVFPKREKICVGSPGLVFVSCECVGAPKLHLGQRANGIAYNDAAVI